MANTKKYHYYVLVFTSEGAKYVTAIPSHNTAEWDKLSAPLELSKEWAFDMVKGLNWNGFSSQVVISEWEIDRQPYNYKGYHFEAVKNEDNGK